MRILVLEDDPDIRTPLAAALREAGYAVDECERASEAEGLAEMYPFDVLVIDVRLPEGPNAGFDLIRRLRANGLKTPALFLTARDALEDRIHGLDVGGDDYLVKPFHLGEVLAHVRALLRRNRPDVQTTLEQRGLRVDFTARSVSYQGVPVKLSAKEYAVLEVLASHPGRVFARDEIAERVWDGSFDAVTNVVDVYVKNVRKKSADWVIETIRNMGYRFPAE
jgi:DNA-binding response OmpR family regulator